MYEAKAKEPTNVEETYKERGERPQSMEKSDVKGWYGKEIAMLVPYKLAEWVVVKECKWRILTFRGTTRFDSASKQSWKGKKGKGKRASVLDCLSFYNIISKENFLTIYRLVGIRSPNS